MGILHNGESLGVRENMNTNILNVDNKWGREMSRACLKEWLSCSALKVLSLNLIVHDGLCGRWS